MKSPKALEIAYAIKKKNAKQFAQGGAVNESAASEQRPMPSERDKDAHSISRNDSKKPLQQSQWTDQPTVAQAQKPSHTKLSRPRIAGSGVFTVRDRDEIEQSLDRMNSEAPDGYGKQPKQAYNEDGPNRQGPSTPSLKMKMMAEGGMINKVVSMEDANEDRVEHPAGLEETDSSISPLEEEFMANHFADGGMAEDMDEEELEHHASVAAAIMARKKFAEGGQVDIESNGQEDYDHMDELNEAALKENYDSDMEDVSQPMDSNEHGRVLSDEDDHGKSLVQKIMARSKNRSPITR